MKYPDLPETLAILKMQRALKEEFDRRERAYGQNIIASGDATKASVARAIGISRTNVDKRFGDDDMRESLKAHHREFQRRRAADSLRLQRVKEAITDGY